MAYSVLLPAVARVDACEIFFLRAASTVRGVVALSEARGVVDGGVAEDEEEAIRLVDW